MGIVLKIYYITYFLKQSIILFETNMLYQYILF